MGYGNNDFELYMQQGMNWKKIERIFADSIDKTYAVPEIDKVIFNGPATIVKFTDGTKSVVKCAEGDSYSEFAGMAIAICKRLYGDEFKKIFNMHLDEQKNNDMKKVLNFLRTLHQNGIDIKL